MKYNSYEWEGKTTKEKATNYANALNKQGFDIQYIDAQLCCISNLSMNEIKSIQSNF